MANGDWVGIRGETGYILAAHDAGFDTASMGDVGTYVLTDGLRFTSGVTADTNALTTPDQSERRNSQYFHGAQVIVTITFTKVFSGDVAVYAWDSTGGRQQEVLIDGESTVLTSFTGGAYITKTITKAIGETLIIRSNRLGGVNTIINGVFFDAAVESQGVAEVLDTDYEVEYGGTVIDLTEFEVVETNLFDAPDIRTSDKPRSQDHGSYPGEDFYSGKSFYVTWELWGTTFAEMKAAADEIMRLSSVQSAASAFRIQLPEYGILRVNCRPRRRAGPMLDKGFDLYRGLVTVEFYADDPRVYEDAEQSLVLSLAAAAENGFVHDLVHDLNYGGISESGSGNAANNGTFETRPVITIAGPVTNPILENLTTGFTMRLLGEVPAGSTLVLDFLDRSVLLDGANRYNMVRDSSEWWNLPPGTSSLRFSGSTAGSPTATVTWRSARA